MYHMSRIVRKNSDQKGLKRYFKIHGNFQIHILLSVHLCKLLFPPRLSVSLFSQLELSASSLDQRLNQYHSVENIFSVLVSSLWHSARIVSTALWPRAN